LNPVGASIQRGSVIFRERDRVMQIRNNYDKEVFNGDVGFIKKVDIEDQEIIVLFDGRPVKYGAGELDELVHSYACSVHKSQGSEYPAVIVMLHTQHYMLLQRNLLYTAITRGKKLCVVVGSSTAVRMAVSSNQVKERRTALAERVGDQFNV
jgi:exodeoxyribonuclease V alpha subunit